MNVPEALRATSGVLCGVLWPARIGGVPGLYIPFREMLANRVMPVLVYLR